MYVIYDQYLSRFTTFERTNYAGGFQPVMMELADALPYESFMEKHLN